MIITIIDSIICKADKELIPHIAPCLQYNKVFWKQGQWKRNKKITKAYFIHRGSGVFLSGLLPRVVRFLQEKNVEFEVKGKFEVLYAKTHPHLDGITLRKDQKELIEKILIAQRGVIKCPTRYGKTITALGFISMFPKAKTLFLCDSLDILNQTADEFEKYKFKSIGKLGDGNKNWKGKRNVISTIQTFSSLDPKEYCDYFDITIVDEVHHCRNRTSQYGMTMQKNLSPIKLGFTATIPTDIESALSMEGLIGEVIGEVSPEESVKLGITMKPKVTLIPVPYSTKISGYTKYRDLYTYGIVQNRVRNKLIINHAKMRIKEGHTVLILTKEIIHGERILELSDTFNLGLVFVKGSTDAEVRNKIKKVFIEKKIPGVISTAPKVWVEGVNIPTLNCTINAMGGKSSIMTEQGMGRGLTKVEGKDFAEIVDFLDPYRFLAEHTIQRLNVYIKNKWM